MFKVAAVPPASGVVGDYAGLKLALLFEDCVGSGLPFMKSSLPETVFCMMLGRP
jgi:hypothetical protein